MAETPAPFGHYTLPSWREAIRRMASVAPCNKAGMWMISVLRKASLIAHSPGMDGPLDVDVAPGVRARLRPRSNRCEKRAFAGVQIWDTRERAMLDQAIAEHSFNDAYVFLDVGANVGLYSLFVNASANAHGKAVKIIAIEPDAENRSRLEFNLEASGCECSVEPVGISDQTGEAILTAAGPNRGGIAIVDSGEGTSIKIETLAQLFDRHQLKRIDAMKVDIEGRDHAALASMVKTVPQELWPRLLIVETGRDDHSPVVREMLEHGYQLRERASINAILEFAGTAAETNNRMDQAK